MMVSDGLRLCELHVFWKTNHVLVFCLHFKAVILVGLGLFCWQIRHKMSVETYDLYFQWLIKPSYIDCETFFNHFEKFTSWKLFRFQNVLSKVSLFGIILSEELCRFLLEIFDFKINIFKHLLDFFMAKWCRNHIHHFLGAIYMLLFVI